MFADGADIWHREAFKTFTRYIETKIKIELWNKLVTIADKKKSNYLSSPWSFLLRCDKARSIVLHQGSCSQDGAIIYWNGWNTIVKSLLSSHVLDLSQLLKNQYRCKTSTLLKLSFIFLIRSITESNQYLSSNQYQAFDNSKNNSKWFLQK